MNILPHRFAAAALLAALTAAAAPAFAAAAAAVTAPAAAPETAAATTVVSVLERFRSYSGERTPAALSALFTPLPSAQIIQQPDLTLSDGSSIVTVVVKSAIAGSTALNFAVNEGKLISHQHLQTGEWHLQILPDAGSMNCALMILSGDAVTEYILSTVPPLAAEIDLSVQGFADFIGSPAAGSAPRLDLNADGRRDYRDDYIFTANFLARKQADPHDPATRNQRARELTPQRMRQKPAN